jgi:ATP-dependent helicase/nuclease subunit A
MTNASPIVNEMVRAGAGAGKTRRLVQTVVDYCQRFRAEHGRFPRLVLTTFTRKSTQELRERLVDRACELQIAELMALFSSPTQIRITTIHGVLAGFLKEYGALAGLDPAFQVIDATTANRMTREILREILQSQDEELLDLFRFDELCAMLRELAPFLWSASPVTAVGLVDLQNARREAIAILNNEIRAACESVAEQTADPEWTAWASGVLRWIERDPETLSEVKPPRWISKKPAVSDDLRAVLD